MVYIKEIIMPIYTRDNIPYSSILANAISNARANAERDANYILNYGKIAGDAFSKAGNTLGRGFAAYSDTLDLEDKLRKLEEERELLIKQDKEANENAYKDYRPAIDTNYKPFEATLEGYNVNANIQPEELPTPNPYLASINQYYRRGR